MSRFDKYDPVSGGFRAPLAALIAVADKDKVFAVALNTSGQVVRTGITTAIQGVICPTKAMAAGDMIDVMTSGEIVEATMTVGTAFTAGVPVYGHADGTVNGTVTASRVVGNMVELDRMIVRIGTPGIAA